MTAAPYDDGVNPLDLDPSRKWLTREEAAAIWGVTPAALSSEVSKGRAPEPKYVGRTPMWDDEILRAANAARPGRGNWGPRDKPEV